MTKIMEEKRFLSAVCAIAAILVVYCNSPVYGGCPSCSSGWGSSCQRVQKGVCQCNTNACYNGVYLKGKCPGPYACQCCVTCPSGAKSSCETKHNGKCQSTRMSCHGRVVRNLCPGPDGCRCCIPSGGTGTGSPTIISRNSWGARPAKHTTRLRTPVPYVIVHHTTGSRCYSTSSCSGKVRGFQKFHMDPKSKKGRGWSDIGYNFLIGDDGNAYTGRGWDNVGAHAPGYNSKSIGITFIGTFTNVVPNGKAISTLKSLINLGIKGGKIKRYYKLIGHRQVKNTSCPGDRLLCLISKWPRWVSEGNFRMPKC